MKPRSFIHAKQYVIKHTHIVPVNILPIQFFLSFNLQYHFKDSLFTITKTHLDLGLLPQVAQIPAPGVPIFQMDFHISPYYVSMSTSLNVICMQYCSPSTV